MGFMTERWALSIPAEEEGLSSSRGSCFTTTGPTAPVPRKDCSPEVGGDRRSSGLILHTGPWATNINSSFSFSFCSSAISFCRPDFSSSSSSVSYEGKDGCEGQKPTGWPEGWSLSKHEREICSVLRRPTTSVSHTWPESKLGVSHMAAFSSSFLREELVGQVN